MEPKKNKYDTNPLDPDVEKKAEASFGDGNRGPETQKVTGATQEVNPQIPQSSRQNVYSEAPTRRIDSPPLDTPYPSIFVPPTYAPPTQQPPGRQVYQAPTNSPPTSRSVAGIGLPEKWAMMLPYAPLFVGFVFSLIELFLVPRREMKVRFHASQALAVHIAILVVQAVFGLITTISGSSFGGTLFKTAATVFLVISMLRVWRGEPHRIAPVADAAEWFNEHIEPRIQS